MRKENLNKHLPIRKK